MHFLAPGVSGRFILRFSAFFLMPALAGSGCGTSDGNTGTIRLVDQFTPESVEGSPVDVSPETPTALWDFTAGEPPLQSKEKNATWGWKAVHGVRNLTLAEGRLSGQSSDEFPLLQFSLARPFENPDLIHSIEIRIRASAGLNLGVLLQGPRREQDPDDIIEQNTPFLTTPLVAGEDMQTYAVQPLFATNFREVSRLLIRPTDAAGARFEIESIQLMSRREHLSRIPSGIGWQGLSEVYLESIVSRSPERIHVELEVPSDPFMDLQVGTVEEGAVTFLVSSGPAGKEPLLQYTVTTPHRWERVPLDLSDLAGRKIRLSFSLRAENPGTLGFWGNPVLRSRNRLSPAASAPPDFRLAAGDEPPQGVILFLADTLRKDHLNAYGHRRDTAPALARAAKEGVLFLDAVSQASWTKVSVPSIMTSLFPSSHGVREIPDRLPAAAETMAEIYRSAGFATIAYSSVPFTGKMSNLHQGFEELHERGSIDPQKESKTARHFVDHFTEWVSRHNEVPFFAFIQVFDPHDPFEPEQPYNTIWADPALKEAHESDLEKVKEFIEDPLRRNFGMPSRAELEKAGVDPERHIAYNRDWYDGSIRGMDVEFSRLLERLKGLGLLERVVIAFISDHGEEFLEHGRTFHGQTVYGELTNVPLFLYGPSFVPSGVPIAETVRSIDLMPTLLQLSHLPVPKGIQGQSLLPLISASQNAKESENIHVEAAALGWRPLPAVSEKGVTQKGSLSPPPHETEAFALVMEGWKLIHHTRPEEGAREFELFDHRSDPFNLKDVSEQYPQIVVKLNKELQRWKSDVARLQLPRAEDVENLDSGELQRLRSLGYIQ